jgi:type VI secretion system secreted protein Hcp
MPDAPVVKGNFRRPLLQGAFAVAATAAVVVPWPAMGDTFLQLAGIKGESTDAKYKDQIEILSFTQSFINNSEGSVGGGGGAGKVQCGAITLMKSIDKSSPLLLKTVATGQHVKDGTITFVSSERMGGSPAAYYSIRLTDVLVTELSQTDAQDPNRIFEKLVLNASTYEFKYQPTNIKGSVGSPVSFKYDCKLNTASDE